MGAGPDLPTLTVSGGSLSRQFHEGEESLPPIHIAISAGRDDICIKIEDRGGGIARDGIAPLPRLASRAREVWLSLSSSAQGWIACGHIRTPRPSSKSPPVGTVSTTRRSEILRHKR